MKIFARICTSVLMMLISSTAIAQKATVTLPSYEPNDNGYVISNPSFEVSVGRKGITPNVGDTEVEIGAWVRFNGGTVEGYKYNGTIYRNSDITLVFNTLTPSIGNLGVGDTKISGSVSYQGSTVGSFSDVVVKNAPVWSAMQSIDNSPADYTVKLDRITSARRISIEQEIEKILSKKADSSSEEKSSSDDSALGNSSSQSGSGSPINSNGTGERTGSSGIADSEEISIPAPVINPTNNRFVDDEMLDFLNATASDSKNPRFKKMVDEFNSYRSTAAQQKRIIGSVKEMSQSDYDEYNMAENLAQAVSVGKFIFTSIFSKKEKNNEEIITPQHREATETISDNSKELRSLFDEVKAIPTFYEFNDKTLAELENYEAKIRSYERVTAPRRLLFWKYINYEGRMDINQLGSLYNQILDEDKSNGREHTLNMIEELQNDFNHKVDVLHMLNAEEGFKGTLNKIQHIRALCYENTGRKNEAEKIRSSLTYNVPVRDAIKLIQSTFKNNNYYGSIKYYQPIKEYFTTNDEVEFIYLNLPNLNLDMDGLSRMDATYLLGLGVLSHIRSGEISQAREELDFLKNFQDQLQSDYEDHLKIKARKKYYKISDTEYKSKVSASKSIVLAVESAFSNKLDNSEEALQIIDQAIQLYDEGSIGASMDIFKKYELWMLLLKTEILIKMENFKEAKELTRIMKNKAKLSFAENENFDMDELRFLSAYIRFKEQDFKGTLFALKLLKKSNPDVAKYYALEEDVYKVMGDQVNAEKARQNYIQTLTKN